MQVKRKHKSPPTAPQPIASDKPLIERTELERAQASLREYRLPEHERIAINERYGAPTAPYRPPSGTAYVNNRKGGKGA